MKTITVGKRGNIVLPAQIRQRYKLHQGASLLVDEREDGIFLRPVETRPPDAGVEVLAPERLAQLFLNNVSSREGYLEARMHVEKMGLNPDSIDHIPWPE